MRLGFIVVLCINILCALGELKSQEIGFFRKQILFESGANGFYIYRIPAIVSTSKGNLVAFAEGRKGAGGDWDDSALVYKISFNDGETWTNQEVLVNVERTPCSNIVPIVDFFEDKIHLLYTVGYNSVFYCYSTDEGLSWTNPLNITDAFEGFRLKYNWKVVATGPGHGTQLTTGRIIVPIWLSESNLTDPNSNTLAHHPSVTGVLYSDDYGLSWLLGDLISTTNDTTVFPNEANCVELSCGRVMFNMRNESINYRRLVSYSPNGISDWSRPYYSDNFFEPICHASMIRYSIKPFQDKNRILFCNPDSRMIPWVAKRGTTIKAAPKRQRSNLTIRMSYDEAETFPVFKQIEEGYAAYSDLAVSPNGVIHCIYESGAKNRNIFLPENISLACFDLEWMTDGKDKLSEKDMPINSNIVCAKDKLNPVPIKRKRFVLRKKNIPLC